LRRAQLFSHYREIIEIAQGLSAGGIIVASTGQTDLACRFYGIELCKVAMTTAREVVRPMQAIVELIDKYRELVVREKPACVAEQVMRVYP
jgi:hypothetical protein